MTRDRGSLENSHEYRGAAHAPHGEPDLREGLPLVTVVIPCYNQAHFLGEAIESVLSQSYRNFEIIVVDDGSTDETSEVASRYEEVRLIRQENRGLSGARNTGIRDSQGEFLVFLDADDKLLPGALEAGLRCFEAHPECAFVFGDFRYIGIDGAPLGKDKVFLPLQIASIKVVNRDQRGPWSVEDRYSVLLYHNFIMHATVMYRERIFGAVGDFNEALRASEDYELYLRIVRQFPIYCHGDMVAEYRRHEWNMTINAGLLLKTTIGVQRSQRRYARQHKYSWQTYKAGIIFMQSWYGDPYVEWVREQIKEGSWKEALKGAFLLARYYPKGLALVVNNKPLLERHLRACEEGVRAKERQLTRMKKELDQQRRELHERTRQRRRLRQRTRRLEEEYQQLVRKLQAVEGSGSGARWRRLLERMGH
jgi:glycosyltransferase involved in cell wall biosynthesis